VRTRWTGALLVGAVVVSMAVLPTATAASPDPRTDGSVRPHPVAVLLSQLTRRANRPAGFVRDRFDHAASTAAPGCPARTRVLRAEAIRGPRVRRCRVVAGRWRSPYDGRVRGAPSAMVIDSVVPLRTAWAAGARRWDDATRFRFAHDTTSPLTLVAVTRRVAAAKADRPIQRWLPPAHSYRCRYVAAWVATKWRWRLSVTKAEGSFLASWSSRCGSMSVHVARATVRRRPVSRSATQTSLAATPTIVCPRHRVVLTSVVRARRGGGLIRHGRVRFTDDGRVIGVRRLSRHGARLRFVPRSLGAHRLRAQFLPPRTTHWRRSVSRVVFVHASKGSCPSSVSPSMVTVRIRPGGLTISVSSEGRQTLSRRSPLAERVTVTDLRRRPLPWSAQISARRVVSRGISLSPSRLSFVRVRPHYFPGNGLDGVHRIVGTHDLRRLARTAQTFASVRRGRGSVRISGVLRLTRAPGPPGRRYRTTIWITVV
jgi:hypothetical protein